MLEIEVDNDEQFVDALLKILDVAGEDYEITIYINEGGRTNNYEGS